MNEQIVYRVEEAVKFLDEQFGKGYAANHPELLGTIVLSHTLENNLDAIYERMSDLVGAV